MSACAVPCACRAHESCRWQSGSTHLHGVELLVVVGDSGSGNPLCVQIHCQQAVGELSQVHLNASTCEATPNKTKEAPCNKSVVEAKGCTRGRDKQHTTHHNTPQHNTTQHNTTRHNTPQHTTTHHNTPHHNTDDVRCHLEDGGESVDLALALNSLAKVCAATVEIRFHLPHCNR